MFNDIICDGKGNEAECVANSKFVSTCCWNSQKVDVLFSVQQLHCPGGKFKSKGHGKLSIHFVADQETVEIIFRIIVFANQLSF